MERLNNKAMQTANRVCIVFTAKLFFILFMSLGHSKYIYKFGESKVLQILYVEPLERPFANYLIFLKKRLAY